MPTPPKALEHMSKNLTGEERQLREQAEEGVIPARGRESWLERPAIMTKNAAAARYWRKVLERMEGLAILDDLDSDALGVYCVMMARYEVQCRLLAQAAKELKAAAGPPEEVAEAVSKLHGERQDAVSGAEHPPVRREAGAHAVGPGTPGPEAGPGGRRGQS